MKELKKKKQKELKEIARQNIFNKNEMQAFAENDGPLAWQDS